MQARLEVRDLTLGYESKAALAGAALDVWPGEVVVLMGPSGCGKSSLLRCATRLIEPDGGSVRFDGRELIGMPLPELRAVRREIGFVFQHFNLIARLNALQNVMLGLLAADVRRQEAEQRALEALTRVGLRSAAGRRPAELSGGEQQRVGIARALALEPKLMLWDEPTAALDPMLVEEVLDVMEELAEAQKTTMLIVTHEVPFAWRVADRVLLMDGGRVVESGSPEVVLTQPSSDVGRRYQRMLARRYGELPKRSRAADGRSILPDAEALGVTG